VVVLGVVVWGVVVLGVVVFVGLVPEDEAAVLAVVEAPLCRNGFGSLPLRVIDLTGGGVSSATSSFAGGATPFGNFTCSGGSVGTGAVV
jgi:hypothetical protein